MYYLIVNKLIGQMENGRCIAEKNKGKWQMVLNYLFPIFMNMVIASGIGHTFKMELPMIVFSIFYTVLRVGCDGNYLKLDVKGAAVRWATGIVLISAINMFEVKTEGRLLLLAFLAFSMLAVGTLAGKRRKKSVILASFLCSSLIIPVLAIDSIWVTAAVVGVLVQSLSLLPTQAVREQLVEPEVA